MDVNDFWQENKRFVLTVAGGAVVFFIGVIAIDNVFGSELTDQERRRRVAEGALAAPLVPAADLEIVRAEHERLLAAHAELSKAAAFVPRPEFAPASGSMANRYFEVVSRCREDLLGSAGRAGIAVPLDLGLPALAPTRDEHIVRTLEGLDVIDRTLRLCFEAGVARVEGIDIKLDPALLSGKPLEGLEKTLVNFKLRGTAASLARLALMLERAGAPRVAVLERAAFLAATAREDDARLELTLSAVRLHAAPE